MCIFSQPVKSVSSTSIFARHSERYNTTYTAYQMTAELMGANAMILPVPGRNVKFINLEGYPEFFDDLDLLFPKPITRSKSIPRLLKVHSVGSFIASFVPTMKDWWSIDPIFQIKNHCWAKLPDYGKHGFVVFKLKNNTDKSKFHPMAYRFMPTNGNELFFPTTHVHDGEVEKESDYDHQLYWQFDDDENIDCEIDGHEQSKQTPYNAIDLIKNKSITHPTRSVFKLQINGLLPNHDTVVKNQNGKITMSQQLVRI